MAGKLSAGRAFVAALLLSLSVKQSAAQEIFPRATNLLVNTVPAEIGAGHWTPVQLIAINYEPFVWTSDTVHLKVLLDPGRMLPPVLELPAGVRVGYIRQWVLSAILRAPLQPGTYPLELQMAKKTGELLGLKLSKTVIVKPASSLRASGLSLTPGVLAPGLTATARFTLTNTGATTAPAQSIQIWASPDPVFWSTRELDRYGWQPGIDAGGAPSPRSGAAMACNSATGRIILFGGENGAYLGDTWTYTPPGQSTSPGWRRLDIPGPPARAGHVMAYDEARGKIVLFGGEGDSGFLGDTWEFTTTGGWRRVSGPAPAPRAYAAMVYDVARLKMVLFGGDDPGLFSDTWEYASGAGWTRAATPTEPPGRSKHAMAYDHRRARVILFGGRGFGLLGDAWAYTPAAGWSLLESPGLASIEGHALFQDRRRDRLMLFGGYDSEYRGETWSWQGSGPWRKVPTLGPTTRAKAAAAYDSRRGKLVIFGGWDSYYLGDTWELLCGGDDLPLGEQAMEPLGPGASRPYAVTLSAAQPGFPGPLPPGAYTVGLITDARDEAAGEYRVQDAFAFPQPLNVFPVNAIRGWSAFE